MIITIQSGILSNNEPAVSMQLGDITVNFDTAHARTVGVMMLEAAISAEMESAFREALLTHGHTHESAIAILKDMKVISSTKPKPNPDMPLGNMYGNEQDS